MKLNNTMIKVLFVLLWFTALTTSCKKGEPGPAGPAGPQGITGNDGNTILSGTGVPASTAGKIGDYYLDTSTSNLYGPKTTSGWGTSVSLKGATGPNGNGILSGNGVPSAALGVNGDFYLDKTTYNLYGPKTAGNWGTPTSLIGPAGRVSYNELGFADIQALESKMTTQNIVSISPTATWDASTIIIFKTNEGRYGKFKVTNIQHGQSDQISIVATIYDANGTLKFLDQLIIVNGTYTCDLDLATSASTELSKDFRWGKATQTNSYIEPNNNAKFFQYK
jgi:hypothetical protein